MKEFAIAVEKKFLLAALYQWKDSKMQDNEAYIDKVSGLLTKELLAVLIDFSERKIRRCNFLLGGNVTPKGKEAADYIQEAIVAVLKGEEGKRKWDEATDFTVHMKGIIRSQISHS